MGDIIMNRRELMEQAVRRGKYAPLFTYLNRLSGREWHVSFHDLEKILGFNLPNSARIYRPWWANQGAKGGHSQALAWEMAGWKTANVDLEAEKLVFVRMDD